ncbi:hypothetical protein KAU33_03935 [Candidatus Dependentiae bacterium]|nr:hypothetical protein [Candidatus Dependentiae bacterium]
MTSKKEFDELETEEFELKSKLNEVQKKIYGYLITFPKLQIDSWDGFGLYEDGLYVIDTDAVTLRQIRKIVSGYEGTIITLRTGEKVKLESYFTKKGIESMRPIQLIS